MERIGYPDIVMNNSIVFDDGVVFYQPTIGKMLALEYLGSPLLTGDISTNLDATCKVLQIKTSNPTKIIDIIQKEKKGKYKEGHYAWARELIQDGLETVKMWSQENNAGKTLGSHYLARLKILLMSKLNITEKQAYSYSPKKASYELATYQEITNGEPLIWSEEDFEAAEILKNLEKQENAAT